MMAAATVAAQFTVREPIIILAGLGGFFVSWLLVRMRSRSTAGDPNLQPVVLRAMLAGPASP